MRRAYLLVYSDSTGTRDSIKAWANSDPLVLTWRYDLPHAFYLISESTAQELSSSLRSHTGSQGRFLISEIGDNRNGWLPPDTWYLLKNKKNKPKGT
jgi:hypothetical protein